MLDDLLREFGDEVHAYMDDIVIYSKNLERHFYLVDRVLKKLNEYGF